MNDKMTEILKSLDDAQLALLARDAHAELRERGRKIDLDEITPQRMSDPEFASQVRAEVERTLREL